MKKSSGCFTQGSEASPCSSHVPCMYNDIIRLAMDFHHHFANIYCYCGASGISWVHCICRDLFIDSVTNALGSKEKNPVIHPGTVGRNLLVS